MGANLEVKNGINTNKFRVASTRDLDKQIDRLRLNHFPQTDGSPLKLVPACKLPEKLMIGANLGVLTPYNLPSAMWNHCLEGYNGTTGDLTVKLQQPADFSVSHFPSHLVDKSSAISLLVEGEMVDLGHNIDGTMKRVITLFKSYQIPNDGKLAFLMKQAKPLYKEEELTPSNTLWLASRCTNYPEVSEIINMNSEDLGQRIKSARRREVENLRHPFQGGLMSGYGY
jgi:hypothetical protein